MTAKTTTQKPNEQQQLNLAFDHPLSSTEEQTMLAKPRQWMLRAAQEWADVHGRPMTVRWARDLALLKPLLRLHGPVELAARWCAYLLTSDTHFAARGWDVPTFARCVDRYAGDVDRAELVGLRNLRPIRDRLTGAVLGHRRGW